MRYAYIILVCLAACAAKPEESWEEVSHTWAESAIREGREVRQKRISGSVAVVGDSSSRIVIRDCDIPHGLSIEGNPELVEISNLRTGRFDIHLERITVRQTVRLENIVARDLILDRAHMFSFIGRHLTLDRLRAPYARFQYNFALIDCTISFADFHDASLGSFADIRGTSLQGINLLTPEPLPEFWVSASLGPLLRLAAPEARLAVYP